MAVFSMFRRSFRELKSVNCLAVTAVLIALYLVMETFLSVDIGFLKINFAFLALAAVGMLYGPSVAMIAAIPCDIIGAALAGHGVLFIFTLIAMFEGLIYGVLLYRYEAERSLLQNTRIITAQALVILLVRIILNTTAMYFLGYLGATSEAVLASITARVIKNVIELPVDCVLMFMFLVPIKIAYNKIFIHRKY